MIKILELVSSDKNFTPQRMEIIDTIRDATLLFAYYPDERWLRDSKFLERDLIQP